MVTRVEARTRRRAEIVAAARTMIKDNETDDGELSMRKLSVRAEVSVTTIYKIFGSKQGLMISVLNDDHEAYREWFSRVRSADPIKRFFNAVTIACQLYASEPNFYKSVQFSVYNGSVQALRLAHLGPRHVFLENIVRDAIDMGALDSSVDIVAFGNLLNGIFRWTVLRWALSDVTLEQLEAEICYGFCVALLPVVSGVYTADIKSDMDRYASKIVSIAEIDSSLGGGAKV